MKPYGLPRIKDVEFPDVADIQRFGLSSHVGQLANKSGTFRSYTKTKRKNQIRRYWKKKIRNLQKNMTKEKVNEEVI